MVFHGPKEEVLPFFEGMGFKLPERKGIADFLQEVRNVLCAFCFLSVAILADDAQFQCCSHLARLGHYKSENSSCCKPVC